MPKSLSILLVISIIGKSLFFLFSIESVKTGFSLPISEAWKDYAYAYIPTVQAFKEGYLPYRDFFHAYPPLFLYALTLFSFLPYFWSMALPLVISDALTVVPVYLIGKRLLSERYAFIASLLFALAPINLLYVDYIWLNPPLTTFFLMASVYFLLARRYDLSAFTLAISIGFKQTSLLALPIVLLFLAKKLSRKMASRYFLIVASICFAFSIPYIFIEPRLYLYSIFRVPIGSWGELPELLSVRFHKSSRIDCDRYSHSELVRVEMDEICSTQRSCKPPSADLHLPFTRDGFRYVLQSRHCDQDCSSHSLRALALQNT